LEGSEGKGILVVVGGDVPYMFYSALSIGNVTKLFEKLSRLSSPAGGGESSIKTPIARPTTEKWAILSRKTLSKSLFPFLPVAHIRGDAIKYSEWPPYNVRGQRRINVAYHIGLYVYLYARSIVFDFY